MPSRPTKMEAMARKAAEAIDAAVATGQQLSLLPDEGGSAPAVVPGGKDTPRKRGEGKAMSQMRQFLAHKGYRFPEDVLVEMAGLATQHDAVMHAMATAEQVMAWAAAGQQQTVWDAKSQRRKVLLDPETGEPLDFEFTPQERIEAFKQIYTLQLRAAEALMPYGAAKVQPDVQVNAPVTQIVMANPAVASAQSAPIEGRVARRAGPPPLPIETQQKQHVTKPQNGADNSEARSE